jgi:hypothetical protein
MTKYEVNILKVRADGPHHKLFLKLSWCMLVVACAINQSCELQEPGVAVLYCLRNTKHPPLPW